MGDLVLKGGTSGQITVTPTAVAGTNTLTLPARTGNIITSADTGTVTGTMLASATVAPANLSTGAPSWDSSGNFSLNSGYGSTATAYGCRAWVNFNGTGTVAIRASGNVSSITDSGTGSYAVNYTNALSSNPCAVASCNNISVNTNFGINVNALLTTSVNLLCVENGAATDKSEISVSVFR